LILWALMALCVRRRTGRVAGTGTSAPAHATRHSRARRGRWPYPRKKKQMVNDATSLRAGYGAPRSAAHRAVCVPVLVIRPAAPAHATSPSRAVAVSAKKKPIVNEATSVAAGYGAPRSAAHRAAAGGRTGTSAFAHATHEPSDGNDRAWARLTLKK
jgi:hypothetical protein